MGRARSGLFSLVVVSDPRFSLVIYGILGSVATSTLQLGAKDLTVQLSLNDTSYVLQNDGTKPFSTRSLKSFETGLMYSSFVTSSGRHRHHRGEVKSVQDRKHKPFETSEDTHLPKGSPNRVN